MELVSEFKSITVPLGLKTSVVRYFERYRNNELTKTELYTELCEKQGFDNQTAIDYVELITGTRL